MEIDTTKPNGGRIYDYLLGGHHHFEADRIAGDKLAQTIPEVPKWMRLNRWFLYHAIEQLALSGFAYYIDLATGLPTQGYLHDRLPQTTRILYNDIDPATVAYARQIIGDRPNIRYSRADIRQIDPILKEAETFFGGTHHVGICLVGAAYFIEDASLQDVLRRLYDWSAPGSRIAISFLVATSDVGDPGGVMTMYQRMGMALHFRTLEQIDQLAQPWSPVGRGLQRLTDYLPSGAHFEQTMPHVEMRGGLFEKPTN
jgi:SAM-dependent methyltransferase